MAVIIEIIRLLPSVVKMVQRTDLFILVDISTVHNKVISVFFTECFKIFF